MNHGSETGSDEKPKEFRAPGDRRPPSADLPRVKKTFLRRRPGGLKPGGTPLDTPTEATAPEAWNRDAEEIPQRLTGHDLYLTYDANGKLRTHTVYHAPKDPNAVKPRKPRT